MNEEKNGTFTIKKRSLLLNLLLCWVTLNVYSFVWLYRVLKDSSTISSKKRAVVTLYWVMIACFLLVFICAGVQFGVLAFNSISISKVFAFTYLFSLPIEKAYSIAAIVIVLLIIESIFAIACLVLQLILVFRLARNLDSNPIYYLAFNFFVGISIVALCAQDVINSYSGVYEIGERPQYYHQTLKALDVKS